MKKAWIRIKQIFSHSKSLCRILLCLAALITISIAADTYEKDNALQIDYSFNGATSQSAVSEKVLRSLDKDVHAYIILSAGSPNQTIVSLFDRYCAISPHFSYSQESLAKSPLLMARFDNLQTDEYINSDCIVLYCESTGRAKAFHDDDFPVYEYSTETGYYSITGYNYDRPFAEGIIFVSQETPVTIQILSGHKELNEDNSSMLMDLLAEKNYNVKSINLLSGDTLEDGSDLLVLCPQYDLTEPEYSKILSYLQNGNGLIYITDYLDSDELQHFNSLLSDFGIAGIRGMVISQADARESYYGDLPAYLMPRYNTTDLSGPLISSGKTRLIMPGSKAFRIFKSEQIDNAAILYSGLAYIRDYIRSAPDSADKQDDDEEGYFSVAVQSVRLWNNGNISRCAAVGNSLMFTDNWLMANTDSGSLMLRILEYINGSAPIQLDIPPKASVREPLDYTTPVPLIMIACIPILLLLFIALKILIPRKRR